jgi:heterodisulfide reductase subunit C
VSIRVDPELRHELREFGAEDVDACFNCGNCTAVCPLSRDSTVFPRKIIRYLQLGLKDKLVRSPEPWLSARQTASVS